MKLKSIHLKGYKSIDSIEGTSIDFGDITIVIGANGVGKSNLISFFSMMNYMMTGSLQNYIAERGYADAFLYFGSRITREITSQIKFEDETATDNYQFRLSYAAGDILIFTEETLTYHKNTNPKPYIFQLNPAGRESDLLEYTKRPSVTPKDKQTAAVILKLLRNCRVFHFQDTSMTSKVRGHGYIEDNRYLNSDGGNLAAFLFRLKEDQETHPYYARIVRHIQKAMPQFGDFDLMPSERNKNYISLNWRDKNNPEYLFGPHQISDGSLRFMCLATLLLQPPTLLPNVIILDEPELGLHPSAIAYFAGMVRSVSQHAQIVMATQSARLVDEFDLEDIVIVERDSTTNSSVFSRKNPSELSGWLESYSLSELWEKNVIGGQP
jgi:predicted ATPase